MTLTNGDKWLIKAHKRIVAWCTTRGWTCSSAFLTSPSSDQWRRSTQHEVFVKDRHGKTVSIAFEMYADEAQFVHEGGLPQGFNANVFDGLIEPYGLTEKPKQSKRQLELFQ